MVECVTIDTLYKANFRANAFYGYADQVWGNFDVVLYQNFNGASSQYKMRLIWDQGYRVESRYWRAAVRYDRFGPDPTEGQAWPYPSYIASNRAFVHAPTDYEWQRTTTPAVHTGKHHDDFYGTFVANGQVFGTTSVHLPPFRCPNHQCKYYGPVGRV